MKATHGISKVAPTKAPARKSQTAIVSRSSSSIGIETLGSLKLGNLIIGKRNCQGLRGGGGRYSGSGRGIMKIGGRKGSITPLVFTCPRHAPYLQPLHRSNAERHSSGESEDSQSLLSGRPFHPQHRDKNPDPRSDACRCQKCITDYA